MRESRGPASKRWIVIGRSPSAWICSEAGEARRRQLGGREPVGRGFGGQRSVENKSGDDTREGGCGLDAVAALAGKPEESRHCRIRAGHGIAIFGEGPKPRPFAIDLPDRDRGGALQPVDAESQLV